MTLIRMLVVLTFAGGLAASCAGAADAACSSLCDKQETCGDIDSVKADQCRKKCAADADVAQAQLDTCINKSDIVTAAAQCLDRACSDYAKCFNTLPACKGSSTSHSSGNPQGATVSCDQSSGGAHICYDESTGGAGSCPSGYTTVSSCPSAGELGTCSVTQGSTSLTEHFYSGGGLTASEAQQACQQSKGAWSGGG